MQLTRDITVGMSKDEQTSLILALEKMNKEF